MGHEVCIESGGHLLSRPKSHRIPIVKAANFNYWPHITVQSAAASAYQRRTVKEDCKNLWTTKCSKIKGSRDPTEGPKLN